LRSSEVWTPQITLFNGDEGGLLADTQVTLTHDGHFRRMPPALYSAYCDLNMLNWPHDKQTCKLKIGSWGLKVILPDNSTGKDKSLDHDNLVQSPEWEIVDSRAEFVSQDYNGYMEYTLVAKVRENSESLDQIHLFIPLSACLRCTLPSSTRPPPASSSWPCPPFGCHHTWEARRS